MFWSWLVFVGIVRALTCKARSMPRGKIGRSSIYILHVHGFTDSIIISWKCVLILWIEHKTKVSTLLTIWVW